LGFLKFHPLVPEYLSFFKWEADRLTIHINIWLYVDMKQIEKMMKLLSDNNRLRILMLLRRRELCVCQIMGVLRISQPLVSRNLKLLGDAGFLQERKEGKLVFYSLRKKLDDLNARMVRLLSETLKGDRILTEDLMSLRDCEEFQKISGKCDMKTFSEYMSKSRLKASRF
jgi:ArsR family transcriptional regulator